MDHHSYSKPCGVSRPARPWIPEVELQPAKRDVRTKGTVWEFGLMLKGVCGLYQVALLEIVEDVLIEPEEVVRGWIPC
jgi:hypothetical protein